METGIRTEGIRIKADPTIIGIVDHQTEAGVVFVEEASITDHGIKIVEIGIGRKTKEKDQKGRTGHKLRYSELGKI